MGPAAQLPLRAPKAPDPHAVQVVKRTNERKLAGWANDLAGPMSSGLVLDPVTLEELRRPARSRPRIGSSVDGEGERDTDLRGSAEPPN